MSRARDDRREIKKPAVEVAAPRGGLECPRCGCGHFEVLRTLPVAEGIRRYRACRHCGRHLVTTEQIGEKKSAN